MGCCCIGNGAEFKEEDDDEFKEEDDNLEISIIPDEEIFQGKDSFTKDSFANETQLFARVTSLSMIAGSPTRRLTQLEIQAFNPIARSISICEQASVDPERFSMREVEENFAPDEVGQAPSRRYTDSPPQTNGVYFCQSFNQYLECRDRLIEPYQVHLEEWKPEWKTEAEQLITQLKEMKCSKKWVSVEHIGSTAVCGLCAKPILDLMITIEAANYFDSAIMEFLRDQEISPLPFKIGFKAKTPFSTDDWGFFQIPHQAAAGNNMTEVNVHIYVEDTKSATEKRIFRNYLNEYESSRKEYGKVKLELMRKINEKELSVALYAKHKNEIVAKILDKARRRYNRSANTLALPSNNSPYKRVSPRGNDIDDN